MPPRHRLMSSSTIGGVEIGRLCPLGCDQNSPIQERDYRTPNMVGKLAPNSIHFTRRLVKYVPGRGLFRAIPSQKRGQICEIPHQSLNDSFCSINLGGTNSGAV